MRYELEDGRPLPGEAIRWRACAGRRWRFELALFVRPTAPARRVGLASSIEAAVAGARDVALAEAHAGRKGHEVAILVRHGGAFDMPQPAPLVVVEVAGELRLRFRPQQFVELVAGRADYLPGACCPAMDRLRECLRARRLTQQPES